MSFFFPCSRFSAAVKNEEPPPAVFPSSAAVAFLLAEALGLEELLFDLELFLTGSSSSLDSSNETTERREDAEDRDEDDLTDFVSISESEGTMKSSSSDAFERDL